MTPIIRHIVSFIFLVLLQVLVLDNIQIGIPLLYVLFILMLPIDMPNQLVLFLGFVLGFSIDIFTGSWGMHAAATTFMAYSRPLVLRLIAPREGYEFGVKPTLREMGWGWFLSYAISLTILHHLAFYFIEIFRFTEWWMTLLRVMISAGLTMVLILLTQFLTYQSRPKE